MAVFGGIILDMYTLLQVDTVLLVIIVAFYSISKLVLTLHWHGNISVHNVLLLVYVYIQNHVSHPKSMLCPVVDQHPVDLIQ